MRTDRTIARNSHALARIASALVVASAAPWTGGCFSDTSPPTSGPVATGGGSASGVQSGAGPQGCTPAPGTALHVAPGGYYTNGSQVCTADGKPHVFHGVDRPSLEWSSGGDHISISDFQAMAGWHANVVRIALNQDWWLSGSANYDPQYPQTVSDAVTWAEQAGLDVILDLHWSDRGNLQVPQVGGKLPDGTTWVKSDTKGYSVQQPMADQNSVEFWREVAGRFKGDGHVLFELYNEPNSISWSVWLHGGTVQEYQAVGMQDLYDAVRGAGADNVVIAGGINWASDLRGVGSNPIAGYNVMYAAHVYKGQLNQNDWEPYFEFLAENDIAPVILSEFGDTAKACDGQWDSSLISEANQPNRQISWTAWAWFAADCSFPALLQGWPATPSVQGLAVQQALAADPAPTPWIDAAAPAPEPDAGAKADASDGRASGADATMPAEAGAPADARDAGGDHASADGASDAGADGR